MFGGRGSGGAGTGVGLVGIGPGIGSVGTGNGGCSGDTGTSGGMLGVCRPILILILVLLLLLLLVLVLVLVLVFERWPGKKRSLILSNVIMAIQYAGEKRAVFEYEDEDD